MTAINIGAAVETAYGQKLVGSWGEFSSPQPEHRILYLSTTVKFSAVARADDQLDAIRYLRPVREVLEVNKLKFKELLQRDIDDHRVAHQMVPYLLGSQAHLGATFFPPILAIFLPNDAMEEHKQIPQIIEKKDSFDGNHWLVNESAPLFKLSRLADANGKVIPKMPLAQLQWNSQLAKLVVIDGQHRLMAMLAIHRTHHREWDVAPEYKRIYEDSVGDALSHAGFNRDIELPLTILTFPELSEARTQKLYPAARKIFVDVNKGAKSPTQSRLILLSDTDLTNIVVRELLETIRQEDQDAAAKGGALIEPPLLPAIQYDASSHDDEKQNPRVTRVVKLGDFRDFSNYLVFYPQWWQRKVAVLSEHKTASFENFKEALGIEGKFGNELSYLEDGVEQTVNLSDLSLYNCPTPIVERFTEEYLSRSGTLLSALFRETQPYAAHLKALDDVRRAVNLADVDGKLVEEALYSGSGTAFTLERIRDEYKDAPVAPAASAAWNRLEEAEDKFTELYAAKLFGAEADDDVRRRLLKSLTEQTRSRACLLGLVMTGALFLNRYEQSFGRVTKKTILKKVIGLFCNTLNLYLSDTTLTPSNCHKSAILSKAPKTGENQRIAFNKLTQLSPNNWVEFRCMWWEILMASRDELMDALKTDLQPKADETKLKAFEKTLKDDLSTARGHLLDEYIDVRKKSLKKDHGDDWDDARIQREAEKSALKEFFETYEEWFGFTESKFSKAFKATKNGQGTWKLD
jgi:hypothetical protein